MKSLSLVLLIILIPAIHGCFTSDWQAIANKADGILALQDPTDDRFMPYIGNGIVATTMGSDSVYLANVYNGRNYTTPSHRARIPSPLLMGTDATFCASFLNLREATFSTRYTLPNAQIQLTWFASATIPNLIITQLEAQLVGTTTPQTLSLLTNSGKPSPDVTFQSKHSSVCPSFQLGSTMISEEPDSGLQSVAMCSSVVPSSIEITTAAVSKTFLSVFASTEDTTVSNLQTFTENVFSQASSQSFTDLLTLHKAHWSQVWMSGIDVTQEPSLDQSTWNPSQQLAVTLNSSLYYILSSISDQSSSSSLTPGGLSTDDYNGHVFWDACTWMMPALLPFHPNLAQSVLQYRYQRLPAAMARAQKAGYDGAMFPWESARTGRDCCPAWAPEGKYEQHITGDIAFAAQTYFRMTGDKQWLSKIGWPLIQNIAEFWASRVTLNPNTNQYEILGVIPPDESAGVVNNSIFTNAVAGVSLKLGVAIAKMMDITPPTSWETIANNLKMPFDKQNQRHLEYDSYSGQIINQNDVGLMQFPLELSLDPKIAFNDLDYYENKTDPNGYFTGDSAYAIAWMKLKQFDRANAQFQKAFSHFAEPFYVWKERANTGGNINFITGAGGYIQGYTFGYAGMRIVDHLTLSFQPHLLAPITDLTLRGIHLGDELIFSVRVNGTHVEYSVTPESQTSMLAIVDGQKTVVDHKIPFQTTSETIVTITPQ